MSTVIELQRECYEISASKGWHPESDRDPSTERLVACMMMAVTELAEAVEDIRRGYLEEYRDAKGKPCGLPSELADAVIRIFDTSEMLGIDLGAAIERKCQYNRTRSHRHGGKAI